MARIALNNYLQQINTLLDENRFSEAIAHCRHILQQFPRHVDTYRLMGKGLLEQGNHDDAADIFQRVLSADPEDFVAHAGLSIVYKEKGNLPASIWHMERAFELDPYNAAVQGELKELYGRRDGSYPARVPLTRGALAHLYVRGGLYQQAITELRQLLAEEPDRVDLNTLLAESLWRDEQRVDAVDICSNVLQKMPNCVKATAILAEVWMMSGRHDEAQEYLQRLRSLTQLDKSQYDAETPVGRAFGADGVIDLPEQVLIEELDYLAGAVAAEETPDWVRDLGLAEGTPEGVVEDVPAWLREIGGADAFAFADETAEAPAEEGETLDWLRQAAVSGGETAFPFDQPAAEQGNFFDTPAEEASQEPEWFADSQVADTAMPEWMAGSSGRAEAAVPAQPAGEMPDWLSEVTGDEEELEGFDFDAIQAAAAGDWMSDILGEGAEAQVETQWEDFLEQGQAAEPAELTEPTEGGDWPRWIQDMDHPEAAALPEWMQAESEAGQPTAGEVEEMPAWPDEIEVAEGEIEGDLPDWNQLEGEIGREATVTGEPAAEAEWPDWLSEVETESAAPPARLEMTAADEAFPDWLSDLEAEQPAASVTEAAEAGPAVADWLADLEQSGGAALSLEPEAGETLSAEEAWPEWMSDVEGEMVAPSTLPEWLEPNDSQATAGDAESGVPDWLRELEQTKDTSGLLKLGESDLPPADEAWPDWLGTVEEEIAAGAAEQLPTESDFGLGDEEPIATASDVAVPGEAAEFVDEEPAEALDWLRVLEESETAGEAADTVEAAAEAAPAVLDEEEWSGLAGVAEQAEPAVPLAEAPLAADEDGLPDWLRLTESGATMQAAEPEATAAADEDEWPAWLRAMEPGELTAEAEPAQPTSEAEAAEPEEWSRWLDEQPETSGGFVTEIEPVAQAAEDFDHPWPAEEEEAVAATGSDWLSELEKIPELAGEELEPVPDWLSEESSSTSAETPVAAAGDEVTDLPNWLQSDEAVEEQMIGGNDEPEKNQEEPPDDFDETMTWLDNLAESQDAPLDELPAEQPDDAAATGDTDLPDWLQMDLQSGAAGDEGDTWLQSANLVESPADWLELASPTPPDAQEASWLTEGPATPTDEIPDWLRARMPQDLEEQPAAPAGDDLDWLDQMTSASEEMEEQPTLSWEEGSEEEVSFSDLAATLEEEETSLDWLAEMDRQTAAPADVPEPALTQDDGAAGVFDFPADADDYDLFGDLLKTEDFQMEAGEGEPAAMMADAGEEDAMTWLEELAAGSPEALPALEEMPALDELPALTEETAVLADLELEPLDLEEDWLAEPPAAESVADEASAKVIVAEGEVFDQLPEEPEDTMAWLEQLAAQQGAPIEELPSLSEAAPVEEVETEPVMALEPEADFELELPAGDEEAMAWLEQLAEAPLDELPELGATDEMETEPVLPEAEVEITAADFVMEMPEDDEGAMAWLEELAAQQGAPIEELPSLEVLPADEMAVEPGLPDEAVLEITAADLFEPEPFGMAEPAAEMEMGEDEAMAWLERLAAQQGAPLDELPSVSEADYSAIEVTAERPEMEVQEQAMEVEQPAMAVEGEAAGLEGLHIPEDPDEAMAWLERLAAQQGAPLDELPSVSAEDYSAIEVTIEPAAELEAVAESEWMEPAASLEEPVEVAGVTEMVEEPEPAEAVVEGEPLVTFVSLDDEVPDDPDAALAWLEQLAAEHEGPGEEAVAPMEVVEEPPTPAVPQSVLEARIEAEASLPPDEAAADMMDEMPEDPEAAMAWLEQLAARQGAPLDELKSVEAMPAEAEVAMPDWVAREMAEAPEEPVAPAVAEEESPEPDFFDAELAEILAGGESGELLLDQDELPPVEELEAAEAFPESVAAEPPPAGAEPTLEGLDTAGIGESLPDWLSFAPAGAGESIDWIDSLVQSDVTGWLTAEEEVTGIQEEAPQMAAPEPEPAPTPRPVGPEPPRVEERPERVERVERAPVFSGILNQGQLAAARDSLSGGDFDTALENYSTLLDSGAGLNVIIADLESAVTRYNRQPLFTRLLGDAYMRNGQLQKALDMYRRALDQL